MSASGGSVHRADVVILTAIPLEYDAVKQVRAGAWKGSQWEQHEGPNGLPVAFRTFRGKGGHPLRVALAVAGDMGAVAATNALLPLVEAYRPLCVAMCGVCAGRPGKTNLGDVIAAERLFFHDTGKKLPKVVQQDLRTYNLRDDWKVAVEQFDFAACFQKQAWWQKRPIPYEWQQNWVLAKLLARVKDPSALPESKEFCPQWEKVIASLWKSGLVKNGTLTLTPKGRERIRRVLTQHRKHLPDVSPAGKLMPFKVHVAPMGSGNQVVEDKRAWSFISEYMRKTLGLEMEAAALGALVHTQRGRKLEVLVMKGVMDFANHGRDDHFKHFAARASAECLIAFLREHLDVELTPGLDDLLVPGIEEELPKNPPPSALLNARYEVVPFHERGREAVLAELDRWCDEGPPVAVRLLHAAGGAGKTRLAIEWIHRLSRRRWSAGFLQGEVPKDWFERLWALGQPVLVVIDYAESRSDLSMLLSRVHRYARQKTGSGHRRVRFLLLARNDGDWWQSLVNSNSALGEWLSTTPPYKLEPLATSTADRAAVFHEAAEWFAKKRGKRRVPRTTVSLADAHFERVLYLHMAALASVEGLAFEANTLMDAVLDHEERYWEVRAHQDDLDLSEQRSMARQLVAAATLRGGFVDHEAALGFIKRRLGHSPSEERRKLVRLLHRIYQHVARSSSSFLPALEPDLLGEGMVLRVASPKLEEDRPAPNWIDQVFPLNEEDDGAVETGLMVLGRASVTRPDLVRPWIKQLLDGPLHLRARLVLKVARAVGQRTALSVLGDALADRLEASGSAELAHELETDGIPYPTVSLRRVAEWVSRTRLQALPATDEEAFAERARLLNNLGNGLSDLRRHEEALKATSEAVELRRVLAQRNPDAFQPYLAMSLSNLGNGLSDLRRHEEALKALSEAVELFRVLAQRNPDAFQPYLAGSLHNLGAMLSDLGRREEALEATSEAVDNLWPFFERLPHAHKKRAGVMFTKLLSLHQILGRPLHAMLQERMATFERLTKS